MSYRPKPIDTSDVRLDPSLDELTEFLARNTHEPDEYGRLVSREDDGGDGALSDGRIEHHRGLIREAVAALDAGPEARTRWLAEPQAPPPKDAGTTTTTGTTSAAPTPQPSLPLPLPPPPAKHPFMSRSQLSWTLWLMFMAAGTVFAWWLH